MGRLVVVVGLLVLATVASAQFLVGFSTRDVSPSQQQMDAGDVFLGGYGFWKFRGRPTGVHDPVWARAAVISGNDSTLALVVLDLPGISNRALKEIRSGVQASTGIPETSVLVSSTHTHSGPDMQGLWGYVSDEYRGQVIAGAIQSVVDAFRFRQTARLFVSKGVGAASNRRGWGYTDTELTTIDARSTSGQRIGLIINFAAHPVTLGSGNLLVSSDFCHYTRTRAEASVGAPVIYVNGAIGDVSPLGTGSDFARSESYGNEIADVALASLASQVEITGSTLIVDTQYFTHPVTNYLFLLAFRTGLLRDYDINDDDTINTQASYIRLGNVVQGVAFPGESLTRNGLPIKDAMAASYRLFFGLNGDTLGYFIPSDEWRSGRNDNYEENVSIDKNVGDTTRDLLVGRIQRDNSNIG